MSKSREQLVIRALLNVGGVAAGQAAAPEDYKTVDDALEPMLSNLASRNIWQWGDPDVIDEDAFLILASLLGNVVARDFGGAYDDTLRLAGEQRLRELQPSVYSGQPQSVDYF